MVFRCRTWVNASSIPCSDHAKLCLAAEIWHVRGRWVSSITPVRLAVDGFKEVMTVIQHRNASHTQRDGSLKW